MKIIVLGHTGFVGRTVYKHLKEQRYIIGGLNSKSNEIYTSCDIVVNCAGNAKKYFAEENYYSARLMEQRIINRLKKIKAKRIIHISSICVKDDNNYGKLKRFVEKEIKDAFSDVVILRLGGLVGKGLSKNVVYDLLNNDLLRVSLRSCFNFIHTNTIAELIGYLIKNWKSQATINVAANNSISVKRIIEIMKKSVYIQDDAKSEFNYIQTDQLQTFFNTESSEFYIKQYLNEDIV